MNTKFKFNTSNICRVTTCYLHFFSFTNIVGCRYTHTLIVQCIQVRYMFICVKYDNDRETSHNLIITMFIHRFESKVVVTYLVDMVFCKCAL